MEEDKEIKNKMLFTGLFSLVSIVLVVGGIIFIAQRKLPSKYKTQEKALVDKFVKQIEPTPTLAPVTGILNLTIKTVKPVYQKGDLVTIAVMADSKGDHITGYDAVVRYDPTLMKVDKVTSLVEGMDLYQTDTPEEKPVYNDLIITGIQGLGQKDPFLFTGTPIAEVTFRLLKSGSAMVDLVFMPNHTADSNLMNTQTQDVLSGVQGVTFSIK